MVRKQPRRQGSASARALAPLSAHLLIDEKVEEKQKDGRQGRRTESGGTQQRERSGFQRRPTTAEVTGGGGTAAAAKVEHHVRARASAGVRCTCRGARALAACGRTGGR